MIIFPKEKTSISDASDANNHKAYNDCNNHCRNYRPIVLLLLNSESQLQLVQLSRVRAGHIQATVCHKVSWWKSFRGSADVAGNLMDLSFLSVLSRHGTSLLLINPKDTVTPQDRYSWVNTVKVNDGLLSHLFKLKILDAPTLKKILDRRLKIVKFLIINNIVHLSEFYKRFPHILHVKNVL